MVYKTTKEKIEEAIESKVIPILRQAIAEEKEIDYYKLIDFISMDTRISRKKVIDSFDDLISLNKLKETRFISLPDKQRANTFSELLKRRNEADQEFKKIQESVKNGKQ